MKSLSEIEVSALAELAKRAKIGEVVDNYWFNQDSCHRCICLICGVDVNYFPSEELIGHGRDHLKEKGLLIFI